MPPRPDPTPLGAHLQTLIGIDPSQRETRNKLNAAKVPRTLFYMWLDGERVPTPGRILSLLRYAGKPDDDAETWTLYREAVAAREGVSQAEDVPEDSEPPAAA